MALSENQGSRSCSTLPFWKEKVSKIEKSFKSVHRKEQCSSLGFDLWATAYGLRDCLLIDHVGWRHPKTHHHLITLIRTHSKALDCFYFAEQLFIVNVNALKQRITNDSLGGFGAFHFVNVSPRISQPRMCNEEEINVIHSALKLIGSVLIGKFLNKSNLSNDGLNPSSDSFNLFRPKNKRKKKRGKCIGKKHQGNVQVINERDLQGMDRCLYPTICGYLLGFPYVYYSDDATSHCLNSHSLTLYSIKYRNDTLIQFSVPSNVKNQDILINDALSRFTGKDCKIKLSVLSEKIKQAVSL